MSVIRISAIQCSKRVVNASQELQCGTGLGGTKCVRASTINMINAFYSGDGDTELFFYQMRFCD